MKKALLLSAFVALFSLVASAFNVVRLAPTPSGAFSLGGGGKVANVTVFAPTNGTCSLKSVYESALFTNAVEISSASVTNVAVVSSNRLAATSKQVPIVVTNGVTVVTNAALGTVTYYTNTAVVVTNVPAQTVFTNSYPAADFTLAGWSNENPVSTFLSISTNAVPVYWKSVAITNTVVTGSAASNIYSNAPAADTYLAPGERMIFDGTALGGFLQVVFE